MLPIGQAKGLEEKARHDPFSDAAPFSHARRILMMAGNISSQP